MRMDGYTGITKLIVVFRNFANAPKNTTQYITKFNVHGSVHRNNILVYKSQQDAHVTEFI